MTSLRTRITYSIIVDSLASGGKSSGSISAGWNSKSEILTIIIVFVYFFEYLSLFPAWSLLVWARGISSAWAYIYPAWLVQLSAWAYTKSISWSNSNISPDQWLINLAAQEIYLALIQHDLQSDSPHRSCRFDLLFGAQLLTDPTYRTMRALNWNILGVISSRYFDYWSGYNRAI